MSKVSKVVLNGSQGSCTRDSAERTDLCTKRAVDSVGIFLRYGELPCKYRKLDIVLDPLYG
ncbi:hypothetical protein KIN20_022793 [Parelaphostrongylus tenuis]|uniref:Uncharacterized protein n=1 Tax=Parelaphostrongylus tenuis TaxID=148309 RepID=A0AAD5MUL8_PARTN|nr:hypothetical protein KIN20_022793 [Parelaphostrongylus tenuis]